MFMKILTIVVPVYNTENYLVRCIESITPKEVLDDIEIILVNDGSKDNSLKILNLYAKKYPQTIKVIDKENGGHGSTINAGLKDATGKYFKVLDSDDWFDTKTFINFVQALKSIDEDVVAVPYTEEYTYIPNVVLYDHWPIPSNETLEIDKIKDVNIEKLYFPMAAATYKTELLHQCGLELFENTFYVDMQYNIYPIPYVKTVRYLKEPMYRYFIGRPAQSMSQENLTRNFRNHEKVLRFVLSYYAKHAHNTSKVKKEYLKYIASCMCFTFFNTVCIKLKDKKTSYKVIREFDNFLKETDLELYNYTNAFGYLRYSRKLGFKNVFCMNLFVKLIDLARKVRSR